MEIATKKHGEVDRISNPTKEEFNQNYGYRSLPAVLTGVMDQWNATWRWTDDFFAEAFGNVEDYAVRTDNDNDKRLFSLADYFRYMRTTTDTSPYYFKNSRFHLKSTMVNDYQVPDYFRSCMEVMAGNLPLAFQLSWMYIGARNTFSKLHLDIFNTSAWNAVISGRKRWLFYPPDQGKYLYNGQVNPFKPDYERFPEFAKAEALECTQNPGEIVFTPTGWWHAVYNEEGGVSITENFINETNYDVVRMTLQYHNRPEELSVVDHCMNKFTELQSAVWSID